MRAIGNWPSSEGNMGVEELLAQNASYHPPKAPALEKRKSEEAFLSERFLQLVSPVLQALTAYPEARAAIALELEKLGQEKMLTSHRRRATRQPKTKSPGN